MLKSIESNVRAFVRFTNSSQRLVEVYWINFSGENVLYTSLEAGRSCVINTFCTHPWIFISSYSGERFQVNHKDVFLPEAWFKFINKSDDGLVSVGRQEATIHFPLKSLRDTCLWKIMFLIGSNEDIRQLDIPKTLKADLLHVARMSTRFEIEDRLEDLFK